MSFRMLIIEPEYLLHNLFQDQARGACTGFRNPAIPTNFYGGPQVSRQKQNARVKSKTLASKAKRSRQKQNARVKSKTIASKAKPSRQKQNSRVKSKTLASTAKQSRKKPNELASKLSEHSEANASLRLFCSLAYGGRIFT